MFWISDVYSQMPFVNICLRHAILRHIVLAKFFPFLNPLYISWIRCKTVGAKQTNDVLRYLKTDHTGVFDTGNNIFEPQHEKKSQQIACALSLIRVFAVRMKKPWVFRYPMSEDWRPGWSESLLGALSVCWIYRAAAHLSCKLSYSWNHGYFSCSVDHYLVRRSVSDTSCYQPGTLEQSDVLYEWHSGGRGFDPRSAESFVEIWT